MHERTRQEIPIDRFDEWIRDHSDVAAVTRREFLVPVEGADAVIFPPTYLKPEDWPKEKEWTGYNIDRLPDGTLVCLLDSVPSQSNRMEALFKLEKYRDLVPRVIVRVKDGLKIDLLDAGHRAADAVVRFSSLADTFRNAFRSLLEGDAGPLARIAPTSLVFGVWDSRGTRAKAPRVLRSVVRAYNVTPLHKSTIYRPPVDYKAEGLLGALADKVSDERLSQEGLLHSPKPVWVHGGVLCREIRRDSILSLVALRALATQGEEDTLRLRRYILGLALLCFTTPTEIRLREGCELVPDPDRPADTWIVRHDGRKEHLVLPHHEQVLEYARLAAREFEFEQSLEGEFRADRLQETLGQERRRRGRGISAGGG